MASGRRSRCAGERLMSTHFNVSLACRCPTAALRGDPERTQAARRCCVAAGARW